LENGKTLLYTKTAVDSLPLTSFKLEEKVCMDPERKYSNPTKVFYPLEVEAEGCNALNTPLGPYWEDNRYRKM